MQRHRLQLGGALRLILREGKRITQVDLDADSAMALSDAMGDWAKDGKFIYAGRRNEGGANFRAGECALFTESSAGYAGIKAEAQFKKALELVPGHITVITMGGITTTEDVATVMTGVDGVLVPQELMLVSDSAATVRQMLNINLEDDSSDSDPLAGSTGW